MTLRLVAVTVLTALILIATLAGLDLSAAREVLAQAELRWFLGLILAFTGSHSFRSVRLGRLCAASSGETTAPLSFLQLLSVNAVGFLAINVVPLRLGELLRPYLLQRAGVPLGRAMAAIVVERVLDMAMLLVLLLGLGWVVELPREGILIGTVDVVAAGQRLAGATTLLGVLAGAALVGFGPAVEARLGAGSRAGEFLRRFRDGWARLVADPVEALRLMALTAVTWACTVTAVGFALAAFPGVPTGIGPAWTYWTVVISVTLVTPTPGFLGAYEAAGVAALWLYGVGGSLARTVAVAFHVAQFGYVFALGWFFLVREGLGWGDLFRRPPAPSSGG